MLSPAPAACPAPAEGASPRGNALLATARPRPPAAGVQPPLAAGNGQRGAGAGQAAGAGLTLNDKTPPKTTSSGGGALQLITNYIKLAINPVAAMSLRK